MKLPPSLAVLSALVLLCGCAAPPPGADDASSPAPPEIGDDWFTATPEDQGMDSAPLRELADMLRNETQLNIHSVLVVKGDRLVHEEYFAGVDQDWGTPLGEVTFDRDTLHDLRSVSKSVTSALVGIAQADGLIPSVETGLLELFPDQGLAPEKDAVTLQSILTMSAGFEWDETIPYNDPRNSEILMIRSPDPIQYVLQQELVATPGTTYNYSGGLSTLLGGLVERGSGMELADFARGALFEPLGITEFAWHRNESGMHAAASGLRLKPRDLAKFGFLYLNEGRWQGNQILPAAWVAESTQAYSKPA